MMGAQGQAGFLKGALANNIAHALVVETRRGVNV